MFYKVNTFSITLYLSLDHKPFLVPGLQEVAGVRFRQALNALDIYTSVSRCSLTLDKRKTLYLSLSPNVKP